jgi:diaminopimelate decarboxylase
VSVDGGMTDNPRYITYGAKYEVVNAGRAGVPLDTVVTIAGKFCESGDLIGENIAIAAPKIGDILAVLCTGAYNYSMSSNYNRVPKPAVVMVSNGCAKTIVRRQTLEDVVAQDV